MDHGRHIHIAGERGGAGGGGVAVDVGDDGYSSFFQFPDDVAQPFYYLADFLVNGAVDVQVEVGRYPENFFRVLVEVVIKMLPGMADYEIDFCFFKGKDNRGLFNNVGLGADDYKMRYFMLFGVDFFPKRGVESYRAVHGCARRFPYL